MSRSLRRYSQSCVQAFFLFFSLPLMRQQPNYTCMLKNLLKLYCIWTWDTLLCFVFFLLFNFFSFWWDKDRTTSETPSPGLEAEGLTPKLLRLKVYCIWTWRFLKKILLFLFLIFIYSFYFFLLSSICLSNACLAYCWLVHYLSLFISLTQFFLLVCLFVFSFFFAFFAFPLLSPFHSKYQHCYYYKIENT
jgi:hypothetical protein